MRYEISLQIYMDPVFNVTAGYVIKTGDERKDYEGAYVNVAYDEISKMPDILALLAKKAYEHLKKMNNGKSLFPGLKEEDRDA